LKYDIFARAEKKRKNYVGRGNSFYINQGK